MTKSVARVAIIAALALGGCVAGPDYRPPPLAAGATPAPALIQARESNYQTSPLPPGWWRLYDNTTLNALVQKALVHNTDLRTALASLEQSQALLYLARGRRLPSTQVYADPTYGQASADAAGAPEALSASPLYDAGGTLSYDLDVAGRLRRAIQLAQADVGASRAALDLARVSVAAGTTQAYADVCSAGLQIRVTERSIRTAQESLYLAQRRFDAGISGANDVVRARSVVSQNQARLPDLEASRRSALFQLATLTGDIPERFPLGVEGCIAPPVLRQAIPVGNGAALLLRRPDVRQAERKLAGAVAQIGIDAADLYPSITLMGGIGTSATTLGDVTRDRGFRWNIGPVITWNWPNTSVTRARVEASSAAARQALAQFDGTVLNALRETETSLVTLARRLDTERGLVQSRDDSAQALVNTKRMYAGGIGQFIDVLDAERSLIQAESSLAQTTAQVAQDQITLFRSLGGGWQNAPAVKETQLERVATPGSGFPLKHAGEGMPLKERR